MLTYNLTKKQARLFLLSHQKLTAGAIPSGKLSIYDYVRHVGCIQYDPLISLTIIMSWSSRHGFRDLRQNWSKSFCMKTDCSLMAGTRTCQFIVQRIGIILSGEEQLLPPTIRLMSL